MGTMMTLEWDSLCNYQFLRGDDGDYDDIVWDSLFSEGGRWRL